MKLGFLKHRWQRRLLRTLAATLGTVLVLGIVVDVYWSPILGTKLKATVTNSSDGLYRINFTDAGFDILQGRLALYNIDLTPDTAVYNMRKRMGIAPNNLYRIHVKKLVLHHIHPLRLYFSRKLDIGEIVLSSPEVHAYYQLNHTKDTTTNTQTLYQRISKTLKHIHIGHIDFNGIIFKYEDYSGNKVAITEVKEMNISASDLLIDSATQTDKSRFLYCRDVVTELNNFSGKAANGLYNYSFKYLRLSTRTSQLNITGLRVLPADVNTFFSKSDHDRFKLDLDSIQINNFDFLSYHKYRRFSAGSMRLSRGALSVFANPNKPKTIKDKSATFPNAGIYKLKTELRLDTVTFDNIDVAYTELNKRSLKTGTAAFNKTHGQVLNLTTDAQALSKNPICSISLTSYFMNRGKLTANLTFNLTDPKLPYTYQGHMGPMNLQSVNPATMPLAMVKINSGKLQSFDFNIRADRYASHGKINLLYNDLKIGILKPDTAENKLKHMMLMSLFANAMIIKHNNPDNPGETPRTFTVNALRPPEFPFFKTVWKTLLLGIRSCAGYGEEKEHTVKAQMAERKVQKAERKAKRAERRARRAAKKARKEAEEREATRP